MKILLGAVLVGMLSSGCWVLDELDSGLDEMDKRAAAREGREQGKPVAEAAPAPSRSGEPSGTAAVTASLKEWWGSARSITPGEDVDDGLVSCDFGDRTSFMLEVECIARGGSPR